MIEKHELASIAQALGATVKEHLNAIKPKQESKRRIPYIPMAGVLVTKPILSLALHARIEEALAPIRSAVRWKKWGMKKKGTVILLHGPPGTGKTTIAKWLAKTVSNGMIEIDMAEVGGGDPGDIEKATKDIFKAGREKQNCLIMIDECDGLLMSRDRLGPDAMWMLTVINNFLTQIESYPGVTVLSTNHVHFLDSALQRRLTDSIEVPIPDQTVRQELWQAKIPNDYPLQLNENQIRDIAREVLTGSDIEKCIDRESRRAIRVNRNPKWESLRIIATEMAKATTGGTTKGKS